MSKEQKFDQIKYNNQYNKEHYERVTVMMPKDKQLAERVRAIAKQQGVSTTQWIIRAIEKELEWYE